MWGWGQGWLHAHCSCVSVTSACAEGDISAALPGPLPLGSKLGAVPLPSPAGKPGEVVSRPWGAPAAPALTWDWSKERGSDLQGAPSGGLGAAGQGLAVTKAWGRCWGQGMRCPCPFPVDAPWSSRPRQEGGKMDPAFLLPGAFHPQPCAASEGAGLDHHPPNPKMHGKELKQLLKANTLEAASCEHFAWRGSAPQAISFSPLQLPEPLSCCCCTQAVPRGHTGG